MPITSAASAHLRWWPSIIYIMAHVIYVLEAPQVRAILYTTRDLYFPPCIFEYLVCYSSCRKILLGGFIILTRSFFFLSDMSKDIVVSSYARANCAFWMDRCPVDRVHPDDPFYLFWSFLDEKEEKKSYNRSSGRERERTTKICFCVCVSGDDVYPTAAF